MNSALLGSLVKIKGGGTPRRDLPEYWGGSIPWATVKDFVTTEINSTQESVTELGVSKSATNIIPAGNIIVPTRMALGKAAINLVDVAINQDLKALIPIDPRTIDRDYLFRFLSSKARYIESRGKGATVKRIRLDVLKELEVPLPPVEEQKRIAAILNKADAIRHKRRQAIELADEFLRSVFLDMFGDPLTNPKKWPMGTIRDFVSEVKYGTSKKAHESKGEYPILRMNNITYQGGLDLRNLKFIDLEEKEKEKYFAKKGDLLFNRTNSKELVGKTAVYNQDDSMAIAGYLIRVRTNEKSDSNYISAYLNSKHGKATLFGTCKNIVGMANINAQELQDIKILLPPPKLQEQYAQIVKILNEKKKTLSIAFGESTLLFKSLTQRAFHGEL